MSLQGGIDNDGESVVIITLCTNVSTYFIIKSWLHSFVIVVFDNNCTMTFFVPPLQDCHLKPLRLLRSNKKKSRKER